MPLTKAGNSRTGAEGLFPMAFFFSRDRVSCRTILFLLPLACSWPAAWSQASDEASGLFQRNCASCHGAAWEGGKGGSLLKERWKYFGGDEEAGLTRVIDRGLPDLSMPAYGGTLSPGEIQALVALIEKRREADKEARARPRPGSEDRIFRGGGYAYRLKTIVESPNEIWALAFLPDGRIIYSEKQGELHVVDPGHPGASTRIDGIPRVWDFGLCGLLDVAVHPDFDRNGWIYLTYVEGRADFTGRTKGMLAVMRGRIREGKWTDQQDLFHLPEKYFSAGGDHVGTRIVLKDGFLFFSIGDRAQSETAQDLASPNGKVFRLAEDGGIPADNPFPKNEGPLAAIWSYGHRNPEGLVFQPGTNVLWESEHGPQGGDEINVVEAGKNYGWPVVSNGVEDHGGPETSPEPRPGMEAPRHDWTPAIAVSAIAFYEGDKFPSWKGSLLAGSLRRQELHRLTVKGRDVIGDEVVLSGEGRIRDVVPGPDGAIYLALNSARDSGSRIVEMVPEP